MKFSDFPGEVTSWPAWSCTLVSTCLIIFTPNATKAMQALHLVFSAYLNVCTYINLYLFANVSIYRRRTSCSRMLRSASSSKRRWVYRRCSPMLVSVMLPRQWLSCNCHERVGSFPRSLSPAVFSACASDSCTDKLRYTECFRSTKTIHYSEDLV